MRNLAQSNAQGISILIESDLLTCWKPHGMLLEPPHHLRPADSLCQVLLANHVKQLSWAELRSDHPCYTKGSLQYEEHERVSNTLGERGLSVRFLLGSKKEIVTAGQHFICRVTKPSLDVLTYFRCRRAG